jgi:chromosome segregation ATPase
MGTIPERKRKMRWLLEIVLAAAVAYTAWMWCQEKAETNRLGDSVALAEAATKRAEAETSAQKGIVEQLQAALEEAGEARSALEAQVTEANAAADGLREEIEGLKRRVGVAEARVRELEGLRGQAARAVMRPAAE